MILKSAAIVSAPHSSVVGVGSMITVERANDKTKRSFTIVGSEEANAAEGKISNRSPFGLGAMGKSKGDSFSFETPSGMMSYKITDIK